eukprot:gnl/Spiro4/5738_TR2937_c0_g1_i1.p1 gnl/Spiro4/5738_TR2937_c0_g1~~gnl/Spiro4/5738_TR2937_c0_g1_i1.p1  ORF type:complete len:297 (-),score=-71.06 gnl/Spiro4/5738_TR2937_c0_g1_i1:828-1718(-)
MVFYLRGFAMVLRVFENVFLLVNFILFLNTGFSSLMSFPSIKQRMVRSQFRESKKEGEARHRLEKDHFMSTREEFLQRIVSPDIVVIASPGRSGSVMLKEALLQGASGRYDVYHTHLLPPEIPFQGKIIYIFSCPDQAAESRLGSLTMTETIAENPFSQVESADQEWGKRFRLASQQTLRDNLLSYDGLGFAKHYKEWLYLKTIPCDLSEAQILAIKYEQLWEKETIIAIKKFLDLEHFSLPEYRPRSDKKTNTLMAPMRKLYNKGTDAHPRYEAYDEARLYWENAPAFEFLKQRK